MKASEPLVVEPLSPLAHNLPWVIEAAPDLIVRHAFGGQ